ncbi:hypothetical protein [Vogesella sp. LIG4]|uniref:hypothetical protein n=1 Tax=Vogesella sp. LIG4 TaxID=1192162 RepID=UPI000820004D|nr:hypothetical protein [Vogesella sp. LIG4]SCK12649.1 hypothetical protein PSELUDRAFT_1145 [Vogesella sp. LIG4]
MKKPAAITPETTTPTQQTARPTRSRRRTGSKPAAAEQAAPAEAVASKAPAVAAAPVEAAAVTTAGDKKKKKTKVVRDSFTMPKSDYDKIAELKKKSLDAGINIKKSELLRAGLLALEAMPVARLKTMLAKVESIKTGRPSSKND